MTLSIIIPVLNDSVPLARLLANLASLRAIYGSGVEIVVVDGGSSDESVDIARRFADVVVETQAGRGRQMNAGALAATGERFWFLHADSSVSPAVFEAVLRCDREWGRCDVRLEPSGPLLRLVGYMMNVRSRITGICTGDQGIFCSREAFERAGGYPDIPLMEDIVLSASLRKLARPQCLPQRVGVDSRRWHKHGTVRTIVFMWWLRLRFFFGANPAVLHRRYYGARS